MQNQGVFNDILEAAEHLSLEEKEILLEILQRRFREQRREAIAREIAAARREFAAGECEPLSPEELMKEILG